MSTSLRRCQGPSELRLCRRATPVWFMGPSRSPGTKSSLTSWLPANATRRVVGLSRASLVLHRRRWAPRRVSWPSRDGAGFHRTTVEHLPGLHSTSESLAQPRPKFGLPPVGFVRSRVASGSVCTAPGLPWTPEFTPPSVRPRASTPGRPCGLPSASEVPPPKSRSVLVVSHHLDGFLRARPAGLLHPAADPGVRRVSRCASTSIAGSLRIPPEPEPPLPRDAFHTPRRSLRPPPHPIAGAVAFLTFLRTSLHEVAFKALLVGRIRWSPRPLARSVRHPPSWASLPVEVIRNRRSHAASFPSAPFSAVACAAVGFRSGAPFGTRGRAKLGFDPSHGCTGSIARVGRRGSLSGRGCRFGSPPRRIASTSGSSPDLPGVCDVKDRPRAIVSVGHR